MAMTIAGHFVASGLPIAGRFAASGVPVARYFVALGLLVAGRFAAYNWVADCPQGQLGRQGASAIFPLL